MYFYPPDHIFVFEIADGASVEAVVIVDSVCHLELFDAFMVNVAPGLPGVVLWTEPKSADFILSGWADVFVINDAVEEALLPPFAAAHVTLQTPFVKELEVAA